VFDLEPVADVRDFIETGGNVLLAIAAATFVMWALILERAWYFRRVHPGVARKVREEWDARRDRSSWYAHQIRRLLISDVQGRLNQGLLMINTFVALCPLLGLLGTVTGIINTFKLITVFGTGDVKTLSGGISEALITTEFGLIVAIPSLLLHALLSRKARGIVDQMEKYSVAFVNQVGKSPFRRRSPPAQIGPLHDLGAAPKAPNGGAVPTDEHIKEIVTDLLIARGMEAIRDQRKTAVTPRHESADDARGSSAARRDVVAGAGAPTAKVH